MTDAYTIYEEVGMEIPKEKKQFRKCDHFFYMNQNNLIITLLKIAVQHVIKTTAEIFTYKRLTDILALE